MKISRQHLTDVLRKAGLPDVAEEVQLTMPEAMDLDEAAAWCGRRGITKDQLISLIGGSP
jgi:hypothetical protein